jgi:hypothetical protein
MVKKGDKGFAELNKSLKSEYPEYKGDANRIITKSLLLEVSVVNIACNQAAMIEEAKSLSEEDILSLKKYGFNLDEESKRQNGDLISK